MTKTVTMAFHGFGVTSYEDVEVINENENIVYLYKNEDGDTWKFDKKTGQCLNDETEFDCYRTINPQDAPP